VYQGATGENDVAEEAAQAAWQIYAKMRRSEVERGHLASEVSRVPRDRTRYDRLQLGDTNQMKDAGGKYFACRRRRYTASRSR